MPVLMPAQLAWALKDLCDVSKGDIIAVLESLLRVGTRQVANAELIMQALRV